MSQSNYKKNNYGLDTHLNLLGWGSTFYVLLFFIGIVVAALLLTTGNQIEAALYLTLVSVPLLLIVVLVKYFAIRSTVYELSSQRLRIEEGIFSRRSEEVELYRIHDWSLEQPFLAKSYGKRTSHILVE